MTKHETFQMISEIITEALARGCSSLNLNIWANDTDFTATNEDALILSNVLREFPAVIDSNISIQRTKQGSIHLSVKIVHTEELPL